jgi:ATP diphosphatase
MTDDAARELIHLLSVMARLRDPEMGCPWDQAQDFVSIAAYTLDEAHEVAAEIAAGPDPTRLRDELGDLLLQVVYHARMAEERGWFGFADVAAGIAGKLVRRHPHVFGGASGSDEASWEGAKERERRLRGECGVLSGIPAALPALGRARRLTERAARVGFDWPNAESVLRKLDEEAGELRAELGMADPARLADEVGDLLFVVANLARKLDLDPEACLHAANAKFVRRFERVETRLAANGQAPADATLEAMETEWARAKTEGL